MADIDRVDERIAHQAADQAHDSVGGENPAWSDKRSPAASALSTLSIA